MFQHSHNIKLAYWKKETEAENPPIQLMMLFYDAEKLTDTLLSFSYI